METQHCQGTMPPDAGKQDVQYDNLLKRDKQREPTKLPVSSNYHMTTI
jgi:hypothetical protein